MCVIYRYNQFNNNHLLIVLFAAKNGDTPLHLAAENNYSDVVRIILKHKQELALVANSVRSQCRIMNNYCILQIRHFAVKLEFVSLCKYFKYT